MLATTGGERISLMFEKSDRTPANLWVERRLARGLMDAEIECRVYLASSLCREDALGKKPTYGRHTALKPMRDLAHADLVRFTIDRVTQLELILTYLTEL